VKGAEFETFEIVDAERHEARDKNYVYDWDIRVEERGA
jgi:hypothetical protein